MAIYFITQRRGLIDKLAEIVDRAEGYHADVRRPGYVTERHTSTDVHPLGDQWAYVFDSTIWKHRAAILDELAKYGISKATVAAKVQRIRDQLSTNESVTFTSGVLNGVTLTWAEKGSDWTPAEASAQGRAR
jgi:hypothetical protein